MTAKRKTSDNPIFVLFVSLLIIMLVATMIWVASRSQAAAFYTLIRKIQLPYLNEYVPYAEYFQPEVIRSNFKIPFPIIYLNTLFYGFLSTIIIMILGFIAVRMHEKHDIERVVKVKNENGLSYRELLMKIAMEEQRVRFFLNYNMLEMPTYIGPARQQYKALEVVVFTDTFLNVDTNIGDRFDSKGTVIPLPKLSIDEEKLKNWFSQKFEKDGGNPFLKMQTGQLMHVGPIWEAIDSLPWYAVLVLYPTLLKVHAFYVESDKGFKTATKETEDFIEDTWAELNTWKQKYKDGLILGAGTIDERRELNALYREKNNLNEHSEYIAFEGISDVQNVSVLSKIFEEGKRYRNNKTRDESIYTSPKSSKDFTKGLPNNLMVFGEVLEELGPSMRCVQLARDGLKKILTRHLGAELKICCDRQDIYPASEGKDGKIVYKYTLNSEEERGFNARMQEKLSAASFKISNILFKHQYIFGIVCASIEHCRLFGILQPANFRWMRFSDETRDLWWAIQNLGMPSAIPENAAFFEHYNIEKEIKIAYSKPYIKGCIKSIIKEAENYLAEETLDQLREIFGSTVILGEIVRNQIISELANNYIEMTQVQPKTDIQSPEVQSPEVQSPEMQQEIDAEVKADDKNNVSNILDDEDEFLAGFDNYYNDSRSSSNGDNGSSSNGDNGSSSNDDNGSSSSDVF